MFSNQYVYYAVTLIVGGVIGLIGFLLKRSLDKAEKQIDEQEKKLEAIENKLNKTINDMPFLYTMREDFIRAQAQTERKLDQIITLINAGGKNDAK